MAELLAYPTEQLPPLWKWQVLSFLRAIWPDGFVGDNRLRDWITKPDDHPHSFILVEGELLIGHVNVVWKELEHANPTFTAYGLTGVFTYPPFQRQGYGLHLVRQAADIALLNCDWTLSRFYQRAGWEPMPHVETLVGSRTEPIRDHGLLMMRFISATGQGARPSFERGQLYFGSDSTW